MSPVPPEGYSWPAYRLFVVHEMERMASALVDMDERLERIEKALAEARGIEIHRKRTQKTVAAALGFGGAMALEAFKLIFGLIFHKP